MSDFKINEIVYFSSSGQQGYDKHDGQECRVVGSLGEYPVIYLNGSKGMHFGYSVVFIHDDYQGVVKPHCLHRATLERNDMDTLVTWDSFYDATGWRRRGY